MFDNKANMQSLDLIGIGFKSKYLSDLMVDERPVGWLEIHAENYMIAGGPRKKLMMDLAARYPISCHGVGLSIGAESGLDPEHLERLKTLMSWLEPAMFSEHLAWSSHGAGYFNDLLPHPYTRAVLDRIVEHIDHVQSTLNRQMLLENPSSYLAFEQNEMSETDFIAEVATRTGCGLLFDVNNVFVSAQNLQQDPYDYVNAYPLTKVQEIHLGGHDEDVDDQGQPLLIDAHNRPVVDPVWKLYEYVLGKIGAVPTLIEWDNDLPEWEVLHGEALRAEALMNTQTSWSHAV